MKTMTKNVFAAIDLGTNSCRLLIADEKGRELYKDIVTTRLGEGMYPEMRFTEKAFERGLKCFRKFSEQMKKFGVTKYRAIATAGCRMASNGAAFVEKVRAETGIGIEVVDGYEEARLNLKGALINVKGRAPYVLVYDLGGGSTEITLATNDDKPEILYTVSIPWGARNATEAFGLENYEPEKAEKLRNEIRQQVGSFCIGCKLKEYEGKVCCVATSSTPLRLTSWIRQYGEYDRDRADGEEVGVDEMDRVIGEINALPREKLAKVPYVGEKRSFIFQAASIIFKTIYDGLGVRKLTASLKSAKDGIIDELVEENGKTHEIG